MKTKRTLSDEQKKLDADLWIIAITTILVYVIYAFIGSCLMAFCKDSTVSVWLRLLAATVMEYGIAGLGIQ